MNINAARSCQATALLFFFNSSVLQLCNLQEVTLKYVAMFYYSEKKAKTQHAPARCCMPVPVTLKSKLDFGFFFFQWCNWRMCCLDAKAGFVRDRQKGYQRGKEQRVGENMDHTGAKLGQITSKYIYMDGFQHWLNRIVKWRFEVFLTKEYDCKHGGGNPRRGFAPFEYTTHFQMCKSSILEFEREGGLTQLTKTQDVFDGWIQFKCGFLCCILLPKASESKVLLCELRPDVRVLVTTDTCEIKRKVRLNAELKASIGPTCAAVLSVAALLLSTYLLNDWPAHVLEKHAFQWYIWRPAQLSPPFLVRSMPVLFGKIFIMFLEIERRCAWGQRAVNYSRAQRETAFWLHKFRGSFCLCRND